MLPDDVSTLSSHTLASPDQCRVAVVEVPSWERRRRKACLRRAFLLVGLIAVDSRTYPKGGIERIVVESRIFPTGGIELTAGELGVCPSKLELQMPLSHLR